MDNDNGKWIMIMENGKQKIYNDHWITDYSHKLKEIKTLLRPTTKACNPPHELEKAPAHR